MDPLVDIIIRRGNNAPAVAWKFEAEDGSLLPVAGRKFVLTVKWSGGLLRKDTSTADGFSLDAATSTAIWSPSLSESRMIPLGRVSRYEIELREGDLQLSIVAGSVTGVGGLNDD